MLYDGKFGFAVFRLTHCQMKLAICSQVSLNGWIFEWTTASYTFIIEYALCFRSSCFFFTWAIQIAQQHCASCNRLTHARAKLNVQRKKENETPDRRSFFLHSILSLWKSMKVLRSTICAFALNKKPIIFYFSARFAFFFFGTFFMKVSKIQSIFIFVFVLFRALRIRSACALTWANTPNRSRD